MAALTMSVTVMATISSIMLKPLCLRMGPSSGRVMGPSGIRPSPGRSWCTSGTS